MNKVRPEEIEQLEHIANKAFDLAMHFFDMIDDLDKGVSEDRLIHAISESEDIWHYTTTILTDADLAQTEEHYNQIVGRVNE